MRDGTEHYRTSFKPQGLVAKTSIQKSQSHEGIQFIFSQFYLFYGSKAFLKIHTCGVSGSQALFSIQSPGQPIKAHTPRLKALE